MIYRNDATMTRFGCDACTKSERVYVPNGPGGESFRPDCPEGWATWPQFFGSSQEPVAVLCPEHVHLIATLQLLDAVKRREQEPVVE